MDEILRGALAGCIGTVVMSATMAVAKAAGMMPGEPPPRQVAGNLEEAAGLRDELARPAFEASWVGQHFAYGTAAGVVYELAQGRREFDEPLISGPLFGARLWAFSYMGWLPATGLYPWPSEEPRPRAATVIVSHLVYGTVTALVARRLRSA
jgi:hypothetical protein